MGRPLFLLGGLLAALLLTTGGCERITKKGGASTGLVSASPSAPAKSRSSESQALDETADKGTEPKDPAAKAVRLKILLPEADASLWVNDKAIKGEGEQRTVKVGPLPAGKDHYLVKALIEPNNYTKITRVRKVVVKDQDEVVVDLRKPDPKHPDDIVVRYVPTPDDVVDAMCKIAKIGPNDVVYDLGCGDGRIVITAVKKYGAKRGVGVDLDADLVAKSKENAELAGVKNKVEFRQGDVLKIKDLPDATVVMLYMGEDINLRLRPILKERLKPGSRVVSHRFTMGDWKADDSVPVSYDGQSYRVFLWRIRERATREQPRKSAEKD